MVQDENLVEDPALDTDDEEVEDDNEGEVVSDGGDRSADEEDGEEEVAESVADDDEENEVVEEEEEVEIEEEEQAGEKEEVGDDCGDDEEDETAVESIVEADEDDDDDGEEVLTAVVIEDEPIAASEDAEPAVEVEEAYKANPVTTKNKSPSSGGKTTKKKSGKVTSTAYGMKMDVRPENIEAANDARATLRDMVPSLPMPFGDIQVRSFGRIHVETDKSGKNTKFSSAGSIFPVGFSCDRFEFSPVHGRVLKMRCTILDGRRIKQLQKEKGFPITERLADGPVFRVVWGQGIDEESDDDLGPFDPELDAPLIDKSKTSKANHMRPKVGMQVQVRFGKNQIYGGVITEVGEEQPSTKESRRKGLPPNQDITIKYDDGFSETLTYPDSDVALVVPGTEYEIDSQGNAELLEWGGKQVASVIANSPLEAWGRVLVKLGLLDEIMLTSALEAVEEARKEVLKEAKDKLEGKSKTPTKVRAEKADGSPSSVTDPPAETSEGEHADETFTEEKSQSTPSADDLQPATDEERKLRERLNELTTELEQVEVEDSQATIALANSRINLLGRFMCNPFQDDASGKAQQITWLATAVRKEKARMGSTGNRKKIVTAIDLLERNDSIYNVDIETLIEGLPGSEYCKSYIFQAFRTSGSALNRAWMLEAQLRQEKDDMRRMKKSRELKEKELERVSQERERKKKRLRKEEVRDSRKRQKLEEEEEKKKQRAEERLSRLRVQVEERLLKEAAAQREKVLTSFAKSLTKEFIRRRKAAEIVAVQNVVGSKRSPEAQVSPSIQPLPPSSRSFEEDTVRVWNFISTFKDFFLQRGYLHDIPSLDSLQKAIDCLRGHTDSSSDSRDDAVTSLTELAIALCQPLAASLTRILFASLIALNPTLQKDFGAAFFNEVNSVEENAEAPQSDVLVPVNKHTWRDVARQSLLADALAELGMQRHEVAHILRGYRSAGHPNSKEARRLRRAEDFNVAVLRQAIHESRAVRGRFSGSDSVTRVDIPCDPVCDPSDFRFFLHGISTGADSSDFMKENLLSAIRVLDESKERHFERVRHELDKYLSMFDGLDLSNNLSKSDTKVLRKIRDGIKKLLKDLVDEKKRVEVKKDTGRHQTGLLKSLEMSSFQYKNLSHSRENYIEDALKLKENLSREKGDDDDEDDDDEDNEAANAVVVDNGDDAKNVNSGVSTENEVDQDEQNLNRSARDNESILDEFFSDIPEAPELIRRCLAVLRTLSNTTCAEPFLYPVDPQSNPAYYDSLVRPMCLREVGRLLRKATESLSDINGVPDIVADFGRNIRLIGQNCLSYANAGPTVIAAGSELLRIFERLLLDWVLSPEHLLPPLDSLDDDKCVESHPTDSESTVLLCDGCEGKYNIARLDPPLREIPKGDWYCPRCVQGRWWGSLDPRVGKTIETSFIDSENSDPIVREGVIESCFLDYSDGTSSPSFAYTVKFDKRSQETWSLSEIDDKLYSQGDAVPPITCLAAVAESLGYGFGIDYGVRHELVPVAANPNVSEAAAQVCLSSSVFRDTIATSGGLLVIDPRDMTAAEWLRLLVLLAMKCASSDVLQTLIFKMETEAAEKMTEPLESVQQISNLSQILPPIEDFEATDMQLDPIPKNNGEITRAKEGNKALHAQPVVVEASSVEVVDEMDVDTQPVAVPLNDNSDAILESELHGSAEIIVHQPVDPFEAANLEKKRRQKISEDSFTAYCIKNQIRSAVASFEEDAFSPLVDSLMSSKNSPLSFSSLRCHRVTCCFCGLTDVALGAPLVRVPSDNEWDQLIPHCARSRQTHLVADMPSKETAGTKKLFSVKVTVGDELFSVPFSLSGDETFPDSGMIEFLPRSPTGYQDELRFRSDSGLPFVTGSLAAHECCAVAAHNARKEKMVQSYKEKETDWVEKEFGMECGRTLEIGRDAVGRSYWKFFSDKGALFVCGVSDVDTQEGMWQRYSDNAMIASVIVSLGKQSIVKDLKRLYPGANELIISGLWSDQLLKKAFPSVAKLLAGGTTPDSKNVVIETVVEVEGGFEPYDVGEKVLVESRTGSLLWDACIVAQSFRNKGDGEAAVIDAYQVSYTDWSTRFTEWVTPSRVVEPNENNRLLQEELDTEKAFSLYGLPNELNYLVAKDFLDARERARGKDPLPDFAHIARCDPKASSDAKTLRMMKAALFAIEAALPVGCIDNRESGPWRKNFAEKWKRTVEGAEGPDLLIRCTIILEDTISLEWIREDIGHLRSCLPARWKAVGEGSASALALRVLLLDRSIMYGQIDRKRFSLRKRKR